MLCKLLSFRYYLEWIYCRFLAFLHHLTLQNSNSERVRQLKINWFWLLLILNEDLIFHSLWKVSLHFWLIHCAQLPLFNSWIFNCHSFILRVASCFNSIIIFFALISVFFRRLNALNCHDILEHNFFVWAITRCRIFTWLWESLVIDWILRYPTCNKGFVLILIRLVGFQHISKLFEQIRIFSKVPFRLQIINSWRGMIHRWNEWKIMRRLASIWIFPY